MRPQDIEKQSFQIIDEEAGPHSFSAMEWAIVRRMIHTSADFEYMQTVRFHPDAITAGIRALQSGRTVVTDTNMARTGIRKDLLARMGGQAVCLMTDSKVTRMAQERETTRARAAVDAACEIMQGGIYAVGNAPTALLRIIELVEAGQASPALVVGLPVGFVNAAESKQALLEAGITCITNQSRKGGSNVAASVVNALCLLATKAG